MTDAPTLLITVTGQDRRGVTAAMFRTLSTFPVEVVDIEQIVLRGRLVLGILITAPPDCSRLDACIREAAASMDMDVEVVRGAGDNDRRSQGRAHVTVLGHPLSPRAVAGIAGRTADTGANIDRIVRVARYPVTAIEFDVSGANIARLRAVLAAEAAIQRVDVAVQPAGLLRHGRRLVVMDMDSTLVRGEAIDLLATHAGVGAEVAALTERAMSGELDFATALRARVGLLAGLDADVLDRVYDAIELTPGARTLVRTLKRLGYRFAIVSGGFNRLADRLAGELGIDYAQANELEIVGGRLTGRIVGDVLDRAGKAAALRRFAADAKIALDQTVAIGDGANDVDMLTTAGLGIAFNATPSVRQAAHTAVNFPYLDAILFLLGISREAIEAADEADAAPAQGTA
ncbi:MAG: phosphoserine phosphatase SerB [Nocardioidaceae bacterium]